MVSPGDITSFFGEQWWSGFGSVGSFLGYILISMLILAFFFFLWQMLQYRIKVTYFPVQGEYGGGDIPLGRPKKDRGRRTKIKGIEYFKLFFARKSLKDIPYKYQYPDGVFLIRKSRDEFEPVARPTLKNPTVSLSLVDSGLQLWDQLRGQEIAKRFTDVDFQRRQMYVFASVIIGCLIFAAIVIWMSYATSNAAMVKTNSIVNSLSSLSDKIGLGPG